MPRQQTPSLAFYASQRAPTVRSTTVSVGHDTDGDVVPCRVSRNRVNGIETGTARTGFFEWLMIALLFNTCSDRDVPGMLKLLRFWPGPHVTTSAARPLDPLRYSSGVRRRTTGSPMPEQASTWRIGGSFDDRLP
jgi:hypothetical protein